MKNIKIKTDTGYVWDLNKLKRLAQIVKRNEEEAKYLNNKMNKVEWVKIGKLEWQVTPFEGSYGWNEAMELAKESGARLPERKELVELFDEHFEEMRKKLQETDSYYWSATTTSYSTGYAWYMYQSYGNTSTNNKTNSGSYRVRCVRSSGDIDDFSQEPKEPTITQISVATLPECYQMPVIVIGFGSDNKVYFWKEGRGEWKLNIKQNYK
jgi:hypothetical protein